MRSAVPPSDDRVPDEITELEFEVTDPTYFFVGLSDDQECRVRLEELVYRSDGTLIEFFTVSDCCPEAIHDRANRTSGVGAPRIVEMEGTDVTFRIAVSGRCPLETIEGAGAIPQSARATDGTGAVIAHVPGCVETGAVIDSVLGHHPTMHLVARRERDVSTPTFSPPRVTDVMWDQLTDRQEEVLRTAYRNGYFRRPRERNGEEIAEILGITSATFSQHLRAAQANLLSVLVEDEAGTGDD